MLRYDWETSLMVDASIGDAAANNLLHRNGGTSLIEMFSLLTAVR